MDVGVTAGFLHEPGPPCQDGLQRKEKSGAAEYSSVGRMLPSIHEPWISPLVPYRHWCGGSCLRSQNSGAREGAEVQGHLACISTVGSV